MRILLVDDHELFRAPLAQLIRARLDYVQVTEAAGLADAEAQIAAAPAGFDLAILDLQLSGESAGAQTIARFRQRHSTIPVLAISGMDSQPPMAELRRLGALGYIAKQGSPETFLAAVSAALHDEPVPAHDDVPGQPIDAFEGAARAPTRRQLQILELLAQGCPDKRIASTLRISEDTVAYHLGNLFRLFGVTSRAQAVAYAFRHGWLRAD